MSSLFSYGKRFLLMILTNVAIMVVASFILQATGLAGWLADKGVPMAGVVAWGVVIGFVGSFVSILMSKSLAKRSAGVQVITTPRSDLEVKLMKITERLCLKSGLPLPEVGIFESSAINAFATGWRPSSALVAVSTAMLREMTDEEIEGVIAHELAHIQNGDMVTLGLIQGCINTFVYIIAYAAAIAISRGMASDDDRHYGGGMLFHSIFYGVQMVVGPLASLVYFGFSRWREYRADAGAARMAGKQQMLAALQKLQTTYGRVSGSRGNQQTAALSISGLSRLGLANLFSTHPPLEKRIAALQKMV